MTPEHGPADYQDDGWWRHHFSGPMLQLWQAIVPPERARGDADLLVQLLALVPGQRVLDVPCGEGRVALELAARGLQVTGVDISPGLLAQAQQRTQALGLAVQWHEADMRALPSVPPFDAAFCWGDSFGYLDDAGNATFLRAVHDALKPGAAFAMEMRMVDELLRRDFRAEAHGQVEGMRLHIRRRWLRGPGRLAVQYELRQGAQVHRCHASYRIHTVAGLQALLRNAGFVSAQALDGRGRPFSDEADVLYLVARAGPA